VDPIENPSRAKEYLQAFKARLGELASSQKPPRKISITYELDSQQLSRDRGSGVGASEKGVEAA